MNYEKIGEFISKKRKEKNMTQKELANKIGVTDKAISKWERGLGCPDVSILEILSKQLDVSILEILKGRIIENEVIPVTEANDYILEATKFSNKQLLKKIVKGMATILIIGICSLLLVLNVSHMLYLNQYDTIDFEAERMTTLKNNLEVISSNIEIIKNDQGIYENGDYERINYYLEQIQDDISNMTLFKYDSKRNIYINDMVILNLTSLNNLDTLEGYRILSKYNANFNTELNRNIYLYASKIYSGYYSRFNYYNYRLIDLNFDSVFSNGDFAFSSFIYDNLYNSELLIDFTNNVIKVGGIHE